MDRKGERGAFYTVEVGTGLNLAAEEAISLLLLAIG